MKPSIQLRKEHRANEVHTMAVDMHNANIRKMDNEVGQEKVRLFFYAVIASSAAIVALAKLVALFLTP